MKRYLVFGYDDYYPSGGKQDVCANVDTLPEVTEITALMRPGGYSFYDVLDLEERRWLDESEWAGAK